MKIPDQFPAVQHGENIHFLISNAVTVPALWEREVYPALGRDAAENGRYYLPDPAKDWTADNGGAEPDQIVEALATYENALTDARRLEEAKALLERERGNPSFYASARKIDEVKPMMVAPLMLHKGVSVIWGPMDEFKTTLVTDLAAHVSVGASWQGLATIARPVIWYALEGADGLYARLKELERRLISKDTPWGSHPLPITVRERIPSDPRAWRQEIEDIGYYWFQIVEARREADDLPYEGDKVPRYPCEIEHCKPLVVIDQVSLALDGGDEKGSEAVKFTRACLDLTIDHEEIANGDPNFPTWPVASHVIALHHPTKAGDDIAGHRSIASDTHGLYRIRRFGRFGERLRPMRTKDTPLPGPITFEVDIVPVPGTQQTTTVLKDKTAEISKDLLPVIEALRDLDEGVDISPKALNECLDLIAAQGEKSDAAKRQARHRLRERLEQAGILEAVEDDSGNVKFYRFHDVGAQ